MMVAFPASSILSRLYYVDGGTHRWLLSWVAAAGWPLTALILLPMYFSRGISPTTFTWRLFMSYAVLGALSAADNLMFAWSYAYLPASTSSLLSSSSLTFTAVFAYFIVGKKWTASILNAIAVITAGAILLGLDANSDRPKNTTNGHYAIGFLLDILGSALHGLIFALSELLFIKLLGRKSFHVVLEVQAYTSLFACIITTIGTIINGDFFAMRIEAQRFHHGPAVYYMVLIWAAICFQLGVLGSVAVLYLTSTLFAGVLNAARVPVTALAAVVCFHDSMTGYKIMALLLTLWGFGSYIYGGVQAHASPNNNKSESSEFAPEQDGLFRHQALSVPLVIQKPTPA
ncbi:hypothetical protein O6H91_06G074000 [Diphasiastrum complanatum]|nr:hypothetical protein O6H91_06G074000 [Diphasiastrum complanatum]